MWYIRHSCTVVIILISRSVNGYCCCRCFHLFPTNLFCIRCMKSLSKVVLLIFFPFLLKMSMRRKRRSALCVTKICQYVEWNMNFAVYWCECAYVFNTRPFRLVGYNYIRTLYGFFLSSMVTLTTKMK